jgi:NarL family two-component system sensor histidine kinase YdfH
MKPSPTPLERLRIFGGKKDNPETPMEWPFFLILSAAFVFVYFQAVFSNAALRMPGRLILFTVLMAAHIALHWLSIRVLQWHREGIYLVVQGVLAFAIVSLGGSIGPLLALYMGLIGETIGLLREKPRWMYVAVAAILGLSLLNYILQVSRTEWYWWFVAMLPLTLFVVVYVVLYSRQAEARVQAQKLLRELEGANRQLTEYAARVEDLTIAAERERMARELHDTLSQGLAGLILQLEAADAHLAANHPERARGILEQSMEKARGTLREARLAIDDLRQPAGGDLAEAIEQQAERFTRATGVECEPSIELKAKVPETVSETAIRVISEGLTNIARHARARSVTLRMSEVGGEMEIEIRDDGVGFDPQAVQAGHYGLLGMRERVRLAGGRLVVQSEAGKGTCILVYLPLENEVLTADTGGEDPLREEHPPGAGSRREQK